MPKYTTKTKFTYMDSEKCVASRYLRDLAPGQHTSISN